MACDSKCPTGPVRIKGLTTATGLRSDSEIWLANLAWKFGLISGPHKDSAPLAETVLLINLKCKKAMRFSFSRSMPRFQLAFWTCQPRSPSPRTVRTGWGRTPDSRPRFLSGRWVGDERRCRRLICTKRRMCRDAVWENKMNYVVVFGKWKWADAFGTWWSKRSRATQSAVSGSDGFKLICRENLRQVDFGPNWIQIEFEMSRFSSKNVWSPFAILRSPFNSICGFFNSITRAFRKAKKEVD